MLRIPNKQELKAIRLAHKLTISQCSDLVGMTALNWSRWEAPTWPHSIDASAWHLLLIRLSGYKQYNHLQVSPTKEELKQKIDELGLTYGKASKLIGFSYGYIYNILREEGRANQTDMTVRAWQLLHLLSDKKIKIKYKDVYKSLEVESDFNSLAIFPDESLYGYISRLLSVNGLVNVEDLRSTLQLRQGTDNNHLVILIANELGMDLQDLLSNHTNLSLKRFVTSGRENLDQSTRVSSKNSSFLYSPIRKKYSYFCEKCIKEDLARHQQAYWRNTHQIPGVDWCYQHGTRITQAHRSYQDIYRYAPVDRFLEKNYIAGKKEENQLNHVLIRRFYQLLQLFKCIKIDNLRIGDCLPVDARKFLSKKGILLKTSDKVIGGQTLNEVLCQFYPEVWLKRIVSSLDVDDEAMELELEDEDEDTENNAYRPIINILLLNIMHDSIPESLEHAAKLLQSEIDIPKLIHIAEQQGLSVTDNELQMINAHNVSCAPGYNKLDKQFSELSIEEKEEVEKQIVAAFGSMSFKKLAKKFNCSIHQIDRLRKANNFTEVLRPSRASIIWTDDCIKQLGKITDIELSLIFDIEEHNVRKKRISLNIEQYELSPDDCHLEKYLTSDALLEIFKSYHDDEISLIFNISEKVAEDLRQKYSVECESPGEFLSPVGTRARLNQGDALRAHEIQKLLSIDMDIRKIALIFNKSTHSISHIKYKIEEEQRIANIETSQDTPAAKQLIALEDLELSDRLINILKINNVNTIHELLENTPAMLTRFINLNKRGISEIKEVLLKNNLSLAGK